jgi:hypothetical protein
MANNLFDASRLYEILKQYNLLPKVTGFEPAGNSSGLFSADTNRIVAAIPSKSDASPEFSKQVLAHEMTHAVQSNLLRNTAYQIQQKIQKGEQVSDQERQYLRASEQIFADSFSNVGNYDSAKHRKDMKAYEKQVRSQYTGINKDYGSYRTSPDEAQAFGVGNMSTPVGMMGSQVNSHLDPSIATEFDILLTMYQKLPEALKTTSAANKLEKIQQNRKTSKDIYLPMSNDLLSDPFPLSIK